MLDIVKRDKLISKLNDDFVWDVVIIGGGASGLGAALESVTRGYKTLLLEQYDYTTGTSSRSTKLVHGGVRYLAQGDISLVLEALKERGLLLQNAPHLVTNKKFLIPTYSWWYKPFYTIGLTMYDLLARDLSFGKSIPFSKETTLLKMPSLIKKGLTGSVLYHDGQFDDARLGLNLAQSILEKGGVTLNYFKVNGLIKENGRVNGVLAVDQETGEEYNIRSKSVLNATGVFVDSILKEDNADSKDVVMASQGVHLVIDKEFLNSEYAIMIPKTSDGRILFAVPWHDKVILGTTDIPKEKALIEPLATDGEIDFILETAGRYLEKAPTRADVKSVFAGLRPLAATDEGVDGKTKEISRSHKILVSNSGLVSIIGGKWTTYRQMGEDVINKLAKVNGLEDKESITEHLKIHGYKEGVDFDDPLFFYGSDREKILDLVKSNPEFGDYVSERLRIIKAQVVFAVRNEMAVKVIDVLARRTRALFLDAKESVVMAEEVAKIMAEELGKDDVWKKKEIDFFKEISKSYILN
ncbi:MAG: glycerol-3-phosphate dehydrogenase/oxidase [Flavobacteriales bacterium]|nr:glycerol-3-phosphate dehydrogenase/oxidase [Flavobacteriales bacterium]